MYIEKINNPTDLKRLSLNELKTLSSEIRKILLNKLSIHGGHVGPNLGMVETTIALHYIFNSPVDKIVYDVSHQSYTHKILTGRKDGFINPDDFDAVSGYTNIKESEHDFFNVGHTSTSVSLALGLAKARDVKEEKGNVIAVIGDGSLSGGEAYEGLNNASEQGSNFIIVVNDNDMSIAENHGGLYSNLKELRETEGKCPNNFFKALGLDYLFVKDGNDLESLIEAFAKVKDSSKPVVVHIVTLKGKGYKPAETNKEEYHWKMPFSLSTGKSDIDFGDWIDYGNLSADFLLSEMNENKNIVAITSGTPAVMGFSKSKREAAGKQFVDVGIAEEHAVAFASGMAANGATPVYGVYSTFIQRCYDQLSQDLCINNNPIVMPVFMGGFRGMNDMTHLGFFDIPLISNIPNMVYLAPTCVEEYISMLTWGINQKSHPVAIRVPDGSCGYSNEIFEQDYSNLNKYKKVNEGKDIAIIALGSMFNHGKNLQSQISKELNINATLINPRFITGIDKDMLNELKFDHQLVVTLEDGVLDGGFGEKISRFYGDTDVKTINYGLKKEFADRFDEEELMKENRLTIPQIIDDIKRTII